MKEIVKIIDDKKGFDIDVLDLRGLTTMTDYFVIASGTSTKHATSIAEAVEEDLSVEVGHKEGMKTGTWILLDYLDIVVHVFSREEREYYGLDRIWSDAKKVDVDVDKPAVNV
jgi:ribosome-associated protein